MYISKNKLIILIILVVILIFLAGFISGHNLNRSENSNISQNLKIEKRKSFDDISKVAGVAFPKVVNVVSLMPVIPLRMPQQYRRNYNSMGSGVIISDDGYILTNNHVVMNSQKVGIELYDKRKYTAIVIGRDLKADIAVLKMHVDGKLPYIKFANSDKIKIGDVVIAVGNPFGLGNTVTMGIISAMRRSDLGIFDYEDFIQTDAAVNPGNSGGALVNMNGELIGINTAIISKNGGFQGVAFAIPSNMAKKIVYDLINTGKVERGWIGIAIQEVNSEIIEKYKFNRPRGVLIIDVVKNGPASKAGIKVGDVIVGINGNYVINKTQFRNMLSTFKINNFIDIEILRNNEAKKLKVKIVKVPDDLGSLHLENYDFPAK